MADDDDPAADWLDDAETVADASQFVRADKHADRLRKGPLDESA